MRTIDPSAAPSRTSYSRRDFLKTAFATALAGLPGCLFTARTELPAGPVFWRPFRFAHLSGLRLSFAGTGKTHHRALRAAEELRASNELDFLLLGGDLVAGTDSFDYVLLEEFVLTAGLPTFTVPGSSAGPSRTEYRKRMGAMGLEAWDAPWEANPVKGLRLVGLDTGSPETGRDRIEEQISFLTSALDRAPRDAVIVLLHRPPRLPGKSAFPGIDPVDSEMLRFVLEAAPNVKMVLSGASAGSFVKNEAGLLYVNTPPVSAFPFVLRVVTFRENGAVFRNRFLTDDREREAWRRRLKDSVEARRYNSAFPEAYVKALEGVEGRVVYPLR
jgi:hypothetical protein